MGLGGKTKKSSGKKDKKENKYVTLMSVLAGKDEDGEKGNDWVKANSWKGRLIWQEFGGEEGDDEDNSNFYEIKKAFIGKPHEDAPEFVLQNIVVNLKNPKAAELLET
jgi:hypothetical protein